MKKHMLIVDLPTRTCQYLSKPASAKWGVTGPPTPAPSAPLACFVSPALFYSIESVAHPGATQFPCPSLRLAETRSCAGPLLLYALATPRARRRLHDAL